MSIEFCPGGDLFFHLTQQRVTEKGAKFLFKQILDAVSYIHSKSLIYRDLKPENIFIDAFGSVKLGDFGLAKELTDLNEFCFNCCGSPNYVAPEIHNRKGYTYKIDYFALGVVLYDIFFTHEEEFSTSLIATIEGRKGISVECRNLLLQLLDVDPNSRLCNKKEIMESDWIKKFPEEVLESPFKPLLKGVCFDKEYYEACVKNIDTEISRAGSWIKGFQSENSFFSKFFG